LQNFTQKDLTEVKIFQKVLGGFFFETPCRVACCLTHSIQRILTTKTDRTADFTNARAELDFLRILTLGLYIFFS